MVVSTRPSVDLLGRTLLGRYRIVMPIGRGGMGTVYLARAEGAAGFAKPVVIKQILPALVADSAMVQLFIREARILSNLHHPGVVNVLDFGEEDGAYVMVLEYVHGYTLAEWGKYALTVREWIPVDFMLHIVARVLDALHYAHAYKRPDGKAMAIIHRDVSPGNVLLDTEGNVKLADFGIARATEDPGEYRSRVGSFKGKLAYSAPELVAGEEASPRSDVYASAVVLQHLLLGYNPFKGQTMADSVHRVLNLQPERVSDHRDDCPRGLDEVLARALAKSPKQRFATAAEFAGALRALGQRVEAEVAAELARQLREDFDSEMAEMLDLEPLRERDAAWRVDEPSQSSLRTTVPPPRAPPATDQTTLAETSAEQPVARETRALVARRRGTLWAVAIATAAAVAGAVVAVLLLTRSQMETAPQFVIIDRKSVEDRPALSPAADPNRPPGSKTSAGAESPAPAEGTETPPKSSAASAASSPTPASALASRATPDTAALSRTVQRHGGRIQGCFQRHVESVGGSPQISIQHQCRRAGHRGPACASVPGSNSAGWLPARYRSIDRVSASGKSHIV
jgi:serine/threonine protein kinase